MLPVGEFAIQIHVLLGLHLHVLSPRTAAAGWAVHGKVDWASSGGLLPLQ